MHPLSTVQPITQRLVKVHAIVEKIAGVNGPLDSSGEWSLVFAKINHELLIPCKQKKLKLKFFFSLNFVSANSMDGNFGVSAPLNGLLGPVCLFDELLQPNHVHILSGAGEHLLASLH